jgi:tetrahydromethanopterin S-methyltransferase subunit H
MLKPTEIVEDEDNGTEDSQNAEEVIEASVETQDE